MSNQRRFSFLVNPASGGGAAPGAVVPVARALRDAGATVEVTYSPGPRAMRDLVRLAVTRGEVVVSVGGDGMLASVAGAVAEVDGTLGLVPAGRGNDFARMLGIDSEPGAVAARLLAGVARPVDLIEMTRGDGEVQVVAGSVYVGVDARAAEIVDDARWLPGPVQYPYAAVRALATFRPIGARIVVDGVEHRARVATVVTANSAFYGSGMKIAPDASVDDGLLEVVAIAAAGKLDLIRSLPKVYAGAHVALDEVTVRRARELTIEVDRPVPVGGDGEPLGTLLPGERLRLRVLPGALRVIG